MSHPTLEDGANYVAARLRTTYEVVSSVWGVASTWTVTARSLLEAGRKGSEELRERSFAGYIVSVRQVDASWLIALPPHPSCLQPLHRQAAEDADDEAASLFSKCS